MFLFDNDVGLLRDVDSVQKFSDVLIFHQRGLVNQGSCKIEMEQVLESLSVHHAIETKHTNVEHNSFTFRTHPDPCEISLSQEPIPRMRDDGMKCVGNLLVT